MIISTYVVYKFAIAELSLNTNFNVDNILIGDLFYNRMDVDRAGHSLQ